MTGADHAAPPSPAIAAATLVVFRRAPRGGAPQILMVERSNALAFAGGAAVFPGGRVDPGDLALAERLSGGDADEHADIAARIAAIRETLEETGLAIGIAEPVDAAAAERARTLLAGGAAMADVLAAMDWTLALDALVPFARWRPDHAGMRNFDTRFYLADLGTGAVEIAVDRTENTHLFWASAADALALADAGHIQLIFPTRRNLERLGQFTHFAEAARHVEAYPSRLITPRVVVIDGERHLCIPDDAGYPVTAEKLDSVRRA